MVAGYVLCMYAEEFMSGLPVPYTVYMQIQNETGSIFKCLEATVENVCKTLGFGNAPSRL